MTDEVMEKQKIYKTKKTYRQIVKLDYDIWIYIGRYVTDNYDKCSITIEQKNGYINTYGRMGEAYEYLSQCLNDIEMITITASSDYDNFKLEIINTQKVFSPTLTIKAECKYGHMLSETVDFVDELISKTGIATATRKNSLTKFIYYISSYIIVKMLANVIERIANNIYITFALVSGIILLFFLIIQGFRRLVCGKGRVLFVMDSKISEKYVRVKKTYKIAEIIFLALILSLGIISFSFLIN